PLFFFPICPPHPHSPLFPYTTLFRSISIDKSRRTTVPQRQQTSTAPSTPQQQQVIMEALEKVITAINQADVSEQEKNEAKSLLRDRKSTRLNSSHVSISYAVFCLKKK